MKNETRILISLVAALAAALLSCGPTTPDLPPLPTSSNTCTVMGSGTCNIGSGNGNTTNPAPSATPPPSTTDNVVKSFAIFCYGFGTVPPQQEPNHEACLLPAGYPNIAVTASPKNAAGIDIPNPGDKTSSDVIGWSFAPAPAGCATLVIQADNRFNARIEPSSPRVPCTFSLTSVYRDPSPEKNLWVANKTGGIQ